MSTAVPVPVFAVLTAVMSRLALVARQHAFGHEGCFKAAGFADEFTRHTGCCFGGIRGAAFHAGATTSEAPVVNARVTATVQRNGTAAALLLLVDLMAVPTPWATILFIGRKGAMPKR